ncbi:MAG: folate-binding protein YgfZ [Gammaproteobacteria bacterium]|nr:folate-binding protein YgfZ [Gammaproteobacteria bacterium]
MHTEWSGFLKRVGAMMVQERVIHFGDPDRELRAVMAGDSRCDLSYWGLIAVQGLDTDLFLQGQLTCDVRQVTPDRSVLGAFCSPKGRVLTCCRLFRREETIYVELPQELLEPNLTRLRKYVLRAKVTLKDASDDLVRFGVAGPHAATLLTRLLGIIPDVVGGVVHTTTDRPGITVIRLPGGVPHFELHGPCPEMQALWETLDGDTISTGVEPWRLLNILTGVPTIYPETVEAFVPQMINLQCLDGVSFQKGCYTGQEVVARMRYLGKLKRRMYLAQVDSLNPPHPGDPLFSLQTDISQSAGRLVDVVRHPDGGYAVLAVALIECAERGVLQLGDANGPMLRVESPPYGFDAVSQ